MKTDSKLSDFDYNLPHERIAQHPLEERDASKLLVLHRYSAVIEHKKFSDILGYLEPGDALVVNASKVLPARLEGRKPSGGKTELLLLERRSALQWTALVRGLNEGKTAAFSGGVTVQRLNRLPDGQILVEFSEDPRPLLRSSGQIPLPPYIRREAAPEDAERYQTVYAEKEGSVAAPTAGLHFTDTLLDQARSRGVRVVPLVLHVGWGTFRGISTENLPDHRMMPEQYELTESSAALLKKTKEERKRIVAVGTTSVRALETIVRNEGELRASSGSSDIFLYPGHKFQAVDVMVTNFHLPCMPPLIMTGAFVSESLPWVDGKKMLFTAYEEALANGYRFASYGDAMLIL